MAAAKPNAERLTEFWMRLLRQAQKDMPTRYWKIADERLRAVCPEELEEDPKLDKRPVVNDLRAHIEASISYLDQKQPAFLIEPLAAVANSQELVVLEPVPGQMDQQTVTLKDYTSNRAICERIVLDYWWHEQGCQQVQSKKLRSALLRNMGCALVVFDTKKGMPALRYLQAQDVCIDPNCRGDLRDAEWMAYRQMTPIDEVMGKYNIRQEERSRLLSKGNTSLDHTLIEEVPDKDQEMYSVVTVWHVFARDGAALRQGEPETSSGPKPIEGGPADGLEPTVRRHLAFVEGLNRPVLDEPSWPFDLDSDEHMISVLRMNVDDTLYGFTDYQQMIRMDHTSDEMMQVLSEDAFESAIGKYLGSPAQGVTEAEIHNFLNEDARSFLPNMLDEGGRPKIVQLNRNQANPMLMQYYEMMHRTSQEASADIELAGEAVSDYKEVTAMGVRAEMERRHRRTNLRLSGPFGYEPSIREDAVKMLEVGHQLVPAFTLVEIETPTEIYSLPESVAYETPQKQVVSMTWQQALASGGRIIRPGIDAIVGPELARYWKMASPLEWKMSFTVLVQPGSTRNLTEEQERAELFRIFTEVLYPAIYQPMGRIDLAVRFLKNVGLGIRMLVQMDKYLPSEAEVSQMIAQMQQNMQAQQQAMQAQQQTMQSQQQQTEQLNQQGEVRAEEEHAMKMQQAAQQIGQAQMGGQTNA